MRALIIVLLLAACAPKRTLFVIPPQTPEGRKCARECQLILVTCQSGLVDETMEQREFRCSQEQRRCLRTCGAHEEWR